MKKIIISIFLLFILALVWLQFFYTPANTISVTVKINARENMVRRSLQEQDKWQQWWPANDELFSYHNQNFNPFSVLINKANIGIHYTDTIINSSIIIFQGIADTSVAEWVVGLPAPSGIVQKININFMKRDLRKNMFQNMILLKQFAEKEENIYGMKILEQKVVNPDLISIKTQLPVYPSTDAIYGLIDQLRHYIKQQKANENSPPMLNVQKTSDNAYEVMVAIPVDRPLDGTKIIVPKRMVLGKILMAEITGGTFTVDKQLKELENYVQDHNRNSPAIPYASLVTDRRTEKDTAKWITQIYYPVY